MNRDSKNCVLFFVKYPVPGRVKTRLAQQIGAETAADLYKNFVTDILAALKSSGVNFKIVFALPDSKDQFQQWLGKDHSYIPQIGYDLGQRMKNAFTQAFSDGFNRVVVIGSDSPDLPNEYLDLAFDTNDVTIGPTSDGGYYLIGFAENTFLPEAFEQISWSTNKVFDQTVTILKQHKRKFHLLPQWHDVDRFADLRSLMQRNKNSAFSRSATMSYLIKHKLGDMSNV
ncbi:MAG: TIGR04282 family arsenosugar biosynthesis glycosyltransferase [Planctomycetota bacterium]|jgi:rSAM/selenodomain-associated transferase 1